ncbi:glycoside hydrolase family 7 protein [Aaosphaeria arxii CBS 175.79]|uniref:Glucanase n=1 Tax=Aaosphaeria arxii CBS 175.79 TaxID=1450172 RepID=A0A6A5XYF3_9PLEO|nr:glycoside hydrolase family 7 protein [Aaosphaeria arxii CBS 175.79]KAF2017996.1 glycoside hydrolase family 7 protein [Aaosphaeria arxii CBS 175.79]
MHALVASVLLGLAAAQTPKGNPDNHPRLTTYKCTKAGGCVQQNTALVLDSASHWIHQTNDTTKGCGNWGSPADPTACPDEETCAKNCVINGVADYADNGVTTSGSSVKMEMQGKYGVASPRIYLLAENKEKYEMLQLTGQEISFDVDVSKLPCGMNGAFYLSEMKEDGGRSKLNPGGATWGTGYCDAQCFTTPWVEGVGNIKGDGVCCNELDIWEANARATHLAPHPCSKPGLYRCTGDECGFEGVCDKDGCGMNPYKHGVDKSYYGPAGSKVNTNKPFTVVTQFPEKDGVLQEIVRYYIQDGKVIENNSVNVTGPIDDAFCEAAGQKDGARIYKKLGATKGMGESMSRGMVLALSIWWDEGGFMKWLDSGSAGPCNATEGDPKVIAGIEPNPTVVFSEIKWGDIGSTFKNSTVLLNRWRRSTHY